MHQLLSRMTFALTVLLLILSPLPLHAQDSATTATLSGSVRDAAGSIIPSATITLRNMATNQTRRIVTEADGSYRVVALPVGDYEVRAAVEGFQPYVNPAVTLALGRTTALDITLRPAEVNAEVSVRDRPPAIDALQTASTTSIVPERIEQLLVNSRN